MAKRVNDMGWDKIGAMIGKKMEKEFNSKECKPWHKWMYYHKDSDGGFFGRALFIIGLLMALNALGLLHGVDIRVQVLIGVGFALMKLS